MGNIDDDLSLGRRAPRPSLQGLPGAHVSMCDTMRRPSPKSYDSKGVVCMGFCVGIRVCVCVPVCVRARRLYCENLYFHFLKFVCVRATGKAHRTQVRA